MASNVTQLYKSVINDVCNEVREAFLDEGVDTDVLTQLKQDWEAKVMASGCVDWDGTGRRYQPAPPVPIAQYRGGPSTNVPLVKALYSVPGSTLTPGAAAANMALPHNAIAFAPQRQVQLGQTAQPTSVIIMANPETAKNLQNRNVPNLTPRPQGFVRLPTKLEPSSIKQQKTSQMDGAVGFIDDDSEPGPSNRGQKNKEKAINKPKKGVKMILQLDGANGISDSESDDDVDERVERLVEKVGDKDNEEDDIEDQIDAQEPDNSPLNSGDDQSDDEDVDTLFDADNVVMCQYEKITRVRNKWKFVLKDGIMHIDNRDYAFQRANGEAEW